MYKFRNVLSRHSQNFRVVKNDLDLRRIRKFQVNLISINTVL